MKYRQDLDPVFNDNAYWRATSNRLRFFGLDGRAIIFVVPLLFFFTVGWVWLVCVSAIVFFVVLERYGYTMENFLRYLFFILGKRKAHGQSLSSIKQDVF